MPTYDYDCSACGHRFELFERVHDDGLKACPKCKKGKAKRQPGHGAGFIFKGSGFYTTDSKSSSTPPETAKKKTTRKDKRSEPKSERKE